MGLFSSKKTAAASGATRPLPQPAAVGPERMAEAKAYMAEWVHIVGQASDPVFWDALARFGRIGDAVQVPENTHSGNMRMLNVAETRFNNDFRAMFDWPWRNWLAIAQKANEVRDYELAPQVFFFAWTIQNQVTFDMNLTGEVGFEKPSTETFKAIAAEARAAATAAPADFAVIERAIQPPVPREAIILGTSQIIEG
jgi:hypothetical protein